MSTESIQYKGYTIKIEPDTDAQSPRDNGDTNLFLIGLHRDFHVNAPGDTSRKIDVEALRKQYKKTHWQYPLEAYIHSGVRLALSGQGNFPDRQWDVSQCGIVFVAKDEWPRQKKALVAANSLIEEWNQYLSGDVWGYVIEGENVHDSCWGFYGHDYCLSEAKAVIDHLAANVPNDFQI